MSCNFSNSAGEPALIYRPILDADDYYHFLFKEDLKSELNLEYSFGCTVEKLFAYTYNKKQRIIIWELNGLNNLSSDSENLPESTVSSVINPSSSYSKVELGSPLVDLLKTSHLFKSDEISISYALNGDTFKKIETKNQFIIQGNFSYLHIHSKDGSDKININYKKQKGITELRLIKRNGKLYLILSDLINASKELQDILI